MNNTWKNLAPNLVRQRLIIEATTDAFVDDTLKIARYLKELTYIVGMTAMQEPFVYTAHEDGYGAWQHWKTSGASFYTYPPRNGDMPLLTLDCYTCKSFNIEDAINFTKEFWKTTDIVYKEILV